MMACHKFLVSQQRNLCKGKACACLNVQGSDNIVLYYILTPVNDRIAGRYSITCTRSGCRKKFIRSIFRMVSRDVGGAGRGAHTSGIQGVHAGGAPAQPPTYPKGV